MFIYVIENDIKILKLSTTYSMYLFIVVGGGTIADCAELSLATQNLSISVQLLLKAERKNKSLTEKVRGFSREVYISRTKRLIRKQVAVNPYLVLVSSGAQLTFTTVCCAMCAWHYHIIVPKPASFYHRIFFTLR